MSSKSNIIFILTDDQDVEMAGQVMLHILSLFMLRKKTRPADEASWLDVLMIKIVDLSG